MRCNREWKIMYEVAADVRPMYRKLNLMSRMRIRLIFVVIGVKLASPIEGFYTATLFGNLM
jgi:hypothetical protein